MSRLRTLSIGHKDICRSDIVLFGHCSNWTQCRLNTYSCVRTQSRLDIVYQAQTRSDTVSPYFRLGTRFIIIWFLIQSKIYSTIPIYTYNIYSPLLSTHNKVYCYTIFSFLTQFYVTISYKYFWTELCPIDTVSDREISLCPIGNVRNRTHSIFNSKYSFYLEISKITEIFLKRWSTLF